MDVEIRAFTTWIEIENTPGFRPENGIDRSNYKRILGDYDFEEEVKCCFRKPNGNLCREDHKRGYVAILTDDSVTIVGKDCARERFGADSAIRRDRVRYENEKRRRERWAALSALLQQENTIMSALLEAVDDAEKLKKRILEFRESLGQETLGQVDDMIRTGTSTVVVQGVTKREYVDEDGELRTERSTARIPLGSLPALSVLDVGQAARIKQGTKNIRDAFDAARVLGTDARANIIDAQVVVINEHIHIFAFARELTERERQFFQSDLTLLCFMSRDRAERYANTRLVFKRLGQPVSKEAAKQWLANREREIAARARADYIEIT